MKATIGELRKKSNFLIDMIIKSATIKGNVHNIWPEVPKDGKWDIKFTMSGIELPIVEAFEALKEGIDARVRKEAMSLISDKFSDLDEILHNLGEGAKREFAERLGVKYEEE